MRKVLAGVLLLPVVLLGLLAAVAGDWPWALGCLAVVVGLVLAVRAGEAVRRWAVGRRWRRDLVGAVACTAVGVGPVLGLLSGWRPSGRGLTLWVTGPFCLLVGVPLLVHTVRERGPRRRSRATG